MIFKGIPYLQTILTLLLCGTALAMLIWRRRPESAPEEDTDEE